MKWHLSCTNFSHNIVVVDAAHLRLARGERDARDDAVVPYISLHFPFSVRFSLRSTFAASERARNRGPVICESTNVCSGGGTTPRNIRTRDLLLVPSGSGSPEPRNIPEEFDSLLAFLGRGRTTSGRRGKRNDGGRKSGEKGGETAAGETEGTNGEAREGEKGCARMNEEARPVTIDRGVGLFMGVPMRTICSKRLVVLNVCSSRAPGRAQASWHNEITDRISLRFSAFRSGRGAEVTALSFFDKRQPRGKTVSQRQLTCRRGNSGTTNFVSCGVTLHAWAFNEKCLLSPRFPTSNVSSV